MAMPVKDFRQLEKMMQLTFSDNDAEALSALRKANEVLRRHGYDWSSTFKRLVKVEEAAPEPWTGDDPTVGPQRHYRDESIGEARARICREAFEELEARQLGSRQQGIVDDLSAWFAEKGWLTDAQRLLLLRIRDEVR